MSWFREQIRQRTESDRQVLEDSFFRMAGAVMDKWNAERMGDERTISGEALNEILKYYHKKPIEETQTEEIRDPLKQRFPIFPSQAAANCFSAGLP